MSAPETCPISTPKSTLHLLPFNTEEVILTSRSGPTGCGEQVEEKKKVGLHRDLNELTG